MLPRKNRITKNEDYRYILKNGKLLQGKYFSLYFLIGENLEKKRFGIICSKIVSDLATERNLIQRAARFGIHKKLDTVAPGIMGAFIAKKEASEAIFKEMWLDVSELLERTK